MASSETNVNNDVRNNNCESSSEDEKPLLDLKNRCAKSQNITHTNETGFSDDMDENLLLQTGICEAKYCKEDVFAACVRCNILVCFHHFMYEGDTCGHHDEASFIEEKIIQEEVCTNTEKDKTTVEKTCSLRKSKRKITNCLPEKYTTDSDDFSDKSSLFEYDSDVDPSFSLGQCEVYTCKKQVHGVCERCDIHVCKMHFKWEKTYCNHNNKKLKKDKQTVKKGEIVAVNQDNVGKQTNRSKNVKNYPINTDDTRMPEDYRVDGAEKEVERVKLKRINKRKEAKERRNKGLEYTSSKSKKTMPEKKIGERCNEEFCKKNNKNCYSINDEERKSIFCSFYELGDVRLQREFILRHVKNTVKKRTTTQVQSRRLKTNTYYLTVNGKQIQVCKRFFLQTLAISEQTVRTAFLKNTENGTVESEKRGGRKSQVIIDNDERKRKLAEYHIDRFERVESHYCRASSTKEYLSEELNIQKMYRMFLRDVQCDENGIPSFATYSRVFHTKNLAFHRPKKDQCSLCLSYRQGNEEQKSKLSERYNRHIAEKEEVRKIKAKIKEESETDNGILCGNFDLQQVISLPICKESALFYKRRLSNYNLTFYNIGNKECHCFTWHEGQSKRGSCEISSAIYKVLNYYDEHGVTVANLFSDGCTGQNKNSIIPTMLLYTINRASNLNEISLRYFEPYHGQSEGDSAHSTISTALSRAGNVYIPSQLIPIFRLARPKNPYIVHEMQYNDFLNFKALAKERNTLNTLIDGTKDSRVPWLEIMEVRVTRNDPEKIFFKTSHLQEEYASITLKTKRNQKKLKDVTVGQLNESPVPLPKGKYDDLVTLCSGGIPVIRNEDHKKFFLSLPHQ